MSINEVQLELGPIPEQDCIPETIVDELPSSDCDAKSNQETQLNLQVNKDKLFKTRSMNGRIFVKVPGTKTWIDVKTTLMFFLLIFVESIVIYCAYLVVF